MKKISILVLLVFAVFTGWSQDLEQINDLMDKAKYREARVAIDKYLSDPKKAGDFAAWYYKGRIYNALAHDSTVPQAQLFTLRNESFNAFKKNQQMDPKDLYLKIETHTSYLDLYYGFYDLGAKEFNNKNYDGALESFKKAMDVKDYILSKKYDYTQATLYPLDTALVLNIAASAIQAKKEEEAITYYKKITDANIGGKDFKDVYEYMVDYYSRKGDDAALNSILEKAKKLYPKNEFWADVELRAATKGGDKATLFAKYEELIAKDPTNFILSYNYGIELYNSLYRDSEKTNEEANKNKLTEVLKKAIANEKEGDISATVLMANHLFNMSADLLNASNGIKSNKPEDVKKKADLKTAAFKTMDDCIVYSESAIKVFEEAGKSITNVQKANYKIMIGYMIDIYTLKNNKVKTAEYQKKNTEADKL
jgi:tetratricopeptide (TPR) repeat protein